jgi:predicted aspartyl protease
MRCIFVCLLLTGINLSFAQSHNWFPNDVKEKKDQIRKGLAEKQLPDELAIPLSDCLMEKILIKCPRREMFAEVFKDPAVMNSLVESCKDVIIHYVLTTKDSSLKFGSLQSQAPIMVKACISSYDPSATHLKIRPELYCECMVNEFIKNNYPVTSIQDVYNENSMIHNELFLPCVQRSIPKGERASGFARDTIRLNLIKANNSYKVKGIFPNKEFRYLIIDSGADYVFINEEDEKKLLASGVITKSNYLQQINVTLGNGAEVSAQTFISTIGFGDRQFKDVIYCVIKECPVPLLGKSFLDKFSSWSIDNQKDQLILIP